MPFVDSRQGPGTLTLGTAPLEVGFQISSLTLTPAVDETDGTPTLALPDPAPEMKTNFTLDGSAIVDYQAPTGLSRYAFDNDGDTVAFVWTPNTTEATPAILTGEVQMRAFPMGGAVGEQNVQDFSWPVQGVPVWSAGTMTRAEKAAK